MSINNKMTLGQEIYCKLQCYYFQFKELIRIVKIKIKLFRLVGLEVLGIGFAWNLFQLQYRCETCNYAEIAFSKK